MVIRQIATLDEIERSWSWYDLKKANAMLDYSDDLAAMHADKGNKG